MPYDKGRHAEGGMKMLGCCLRLKESYASLSPKEQLVASFILEYPSEVVNMSIEELAVSCNTSTSSVVRLCKSMGYSGYKELCRMLSTDLALSSQEITYTDVRPGDSLDSIVRNVCMSSVRAIENTMTMLEGDELGRAVDALCAARRIDFYGVGTSGTVALDAHNKFLRINKLSIASADPHVQILSATSLKPGDVAMLISYTGETRDILETHDIVRQTGATAITLTRYGKNSLSDKADIRLFSSSSETMTRSGATGSRIGQLTVVDVLYTAVASRLYDEVKPYLDKTRLTSGRKRMRTRT